MSVIRIYFTGVGGQGNLLASKLLGEAALLAGVPVVLGETHGMAQRGGVVESTVVLGGARSATISDGQADYLVAFEPLEALRALAKCNPASRLAVSTSPIVPFTVALRQAEYPGPETTLAYLRAKLARVVALDAQAEALAVGHPRGANLVLLGALLALGGLPVEQEHLRQAVARKTKPAFLAANLACLERGLAAGGRCV